MPYSRQDFEHDKTQVSDIGTDLALVLQKYRERSLVHILLGIAVTAAGAISAAPAREDALFLFGQAINDFIDIFDEMGGDPRKLH